MNTNLIRQLCLISLLMFVACSSEKPTEISSARQSEPGGMNESPSNLQTAAGQLPYLLEITNTDLNRKSAVQLKVNGFELSDAAIEWIADGKLFSGASSLSSLPEGIKKGELVQIRATIAGKEIRSNIIKVGNAPPEISRIQFIPEKSKAGDTLSVDVAGIDADGDEVSILYEWTRNNEPAGNEKKIAGTLKRGDKVSVTITPFDGEVYGKSAVLQREIRNMPPMIAEDRTFSLKGALYAYQVKATDPDGDALVYALASSPAGMTIDQRGLIYWNVPAEFRGKTSFVVSVNDGNGGEAKQELIFDLKPESNK